MTAVHVSIIYYSATGNLHTMAQAAAEGAEKAGATVRLRNTGPRPGAETVQIYLAPETETAGRAARQLAGFARAGAAPGETVEVTVPLDRRAYEIWDETTGGWQLVPGAYQVQAARSVADIRVTAPVEIKE